jgi:hypothetical protein
MIRISSPVNLRDGRAAAEYHEPSFDPRQVPHTPALRSIETAAQMSDRPLALRRASPFFCGHILQHGVVEHSFRQQLRQLRVLDLKCLQPLSVGNL